MMKRVIWLYVFLCAAAWPGPAQDLYDFSHSLQFAAYLYKSGEYRLAAAEYERVVYLQPDEPALRLQLVSSYRLAGEYARARQRAEGAVAPPRMWPGLAGAYSRVLLQQGDLGAARRFLTATDSLPRQERLLLLTATEMLDLNWRRADSLLQARGLPPNDLPWRNLRSLTDAGLAARYKQPALAVGLSAVVPGLGKAYAGYWKDGLFSLIFTGVSAWQAYRGFAQNGIESPYAWLYTGLATGFYLGNLYGSGKAAGRRNRQIRHDLRHRVEHSLQSLFE